MVRLASVSFRTLTEPRAFEWTARHTAIGADLLRAYGRDPGGVDFADWRGHTFRSMSEELLAHCPVPVPELDLIVLAYQTPDLHVAESAGCYLAERCPGTPVPFAVSEQASGAPFTALRVAGAMHRDGALRAGAVFVLDPTTPVNDGDPRSVAARDCAALLLVGGDRGPTVESIQDSPCPDAATGLRSLRGPATTIVGTALARALPSSTVDGSCVVAGPPDALCASAWIALAGRLPLDGPVLVADYDPYARRLYSCVVRP
jgi:hypothetical protein